MHESPEPKPDFQTAHIGLVHATGLELAPLIARCDRVHKYVAAGGVTFKGGMLRDCRVAFAQVGMGPERAARGTQALLDGHRPQWVISAGFSGALVPELAAGEIVVGNVIRDISGRELTIDLKMPANPAAGLHVGKLLTIDHVARTADEKERLGCETGALAVDMESAAVAAVCRERKTRFMAVRVISDDMQSEVPAEAVSILGDNGALQIGAAVAALWKRPGSAKDLWDLRTSANQSAERLARFLEGVILQLRESVPA